MGAVLFWLLASIVTCAIVGALGHLTAGIAATIFIIWAVLTWGGVLIFGDGDFNLFD